MLSAFTDIPTMPGKPPIKPHSTAICEGPPGVVSVLWLLQLNWLTSENLGPQRSVHPPPEEDGPASPAHRPASPAPNRQPRPPPCQPRPQPPAPPSILPTEGASLKRKGEVSAL